MVSRRTTRILLRGFLTLALFIVGCFIYQSPLKSLYLQSDLETVIDAAGNSRPIEPRLTGGFHWSPLSIGLGERPTPTAFPALLKIARRLKRTIGEEPSADGLRAFAGACLISGDSQSAVHAYEQALKLAPKDPNLRSDLAAALLVRGEPADANAALAWTDRAIAEDKNLAEAWFNRTLALEKLSLESAARAARQAYLNIDGNSDWAQEVRNRLERPTSSTRTQWEIERKRLIDLKFQPNVSGAVRKFSQECRELVEEELLALAGQRILAGDRSSAEEYLGRSRSIATELFNQSGDRMPLTAVDAMARQSESTRAVLAQGHIAYSKARPLQDKFAYAEAEPLLSYSRERLMLAKSPFALWADVQLAIIHYQKRDLDRAEALLLRVLSEADSRGYITLAARSEWLLSLVDISRNKLSSTLGRLDVALKKFEKTREVENIAAIQTIQAEQDRLLGETEQSWKSLQPALAALPRVRKLPRQQATLVTAAEASLRQGLPEAGLYYQQEFIELSRRAGAPISEAEGYLHRAKLFLKLGDMKHAQHDLTEARAELGRAGDHALRSLIEAQVLLAEAAVIEQRQPNEAAEKIKNAIALFELDQRAPFLSSAYLALARTFRKLGDLPKAESALRSGLVNFEQQQRSLRGNVLRLSLFDESWQLFDSMIDLQIDLRNYRAAFRFSELFKSRILAESAQPNSTTGNVDDLVHRLPQNTAIIEYTVTPLRWVAWVITAKGSHIVQHDTDAKRLDQLVREYRVAIERGTKEELQRSSAALNDEIIKPLNSYIKPGLTLIIVPDASLRWVPFAALRDHLTGRFLVEDHEIILAPSARLALREGKKTWDVRSALVVGNPSIQRDLHPELQDLPGAGTEAENVASQYEVADLLIEGSATRSRFLGELWKYDVVHFSGHGLMNAEYPELASLLLTPDEEGQRGEVYSYEIEAAGRDQGNRPDLVVLGACESARGADYRGEGVLSLVRPFLAVGVPAVIASYWNVDDKAVGEFFRQLHGEYLKTRTAAGALRKAQVEALRKGEPPSLWASFSVFGSSR